MIIEEKDFLLEEEGNHYNLELLHCINKGKANERFELKNEAYGCTLESAITRIAKYRMNHGDKIGTITMCEYLVLLRKYKDELHQLIHNKLCV